jgi:hypothetical protein
MEYCTACSQLDISLSAFISHPGSDNNPRICAPVYCLESLDRIASRTQHCHLCRLVFAAFRSGPIKGSTNVTNLGKIAIFATWISALGSTKDKRLQSPTLCILIWAESPSTLPATYKIIVRASSRMLLDQPHFACISTFKSSLLDYRQIKHWLKHCEGAHRSCFRKARPARPTKELFVVNVISKSIVVAPEFCRYLALSYVWGGASQMRLSEDNVDMFAQTNSLREEYLTATIQDAMVLTENLGEQYLWVDALCIVQDSDAIRQQTIQDMDRIYNESVLTIVAATCTSANDPLPGVSKHRVWTQWYQQISPNLTLSAHFDYKDFIQGSKYNERAWT